MLPRLDLLALGEALVEFNQQPDRPADCLQGFGGDTSNVAAALSTTGFGAIAPIPCADAVQAAIKAR